ETSGTARGNDRPRPKMIAAAVAVVAIGVTLAATMLIQRASAPETRTIAVQPFETKTSDPAVAAMASTVADRLTDGLSKIGNVRVLAPEAQPVVANIAAPPTAKADLVVRGELQREDDQWQLQARLIDSHTGQVQWAGGIRVSVNTISERLQQSRLTAGIGAPLALRINALTQRAMQPESKIIAEQAAAFLNQTNRERFKVAQELLEKSHAAAPNDVEISAALSAHLMRGVAMVWYPPDQLEGIEKRARDLLRDAVKTEPSYIPVLQAYCRLLQNTNQFAETLVACENALRFDPWDGLVMFQIGMAQLRLGRYQDALATFERADAADTPEVSRWTWLLGAGLTLTLMERYDDALTWLHRSRAITPATGRTDFMIATCYQALGRYEEARVAVATGLRLRPGTTGETVGLPPKNESPRFLADSAKVRELLVAAGLPPK
ncbi:tetratricopeptide repeat protein, partial [Rhodopseudomonas sp. BR0M22]|uniref:tetratricopeptide repeat protein n=1 Tax=Rhodopseudomonas sp. BR0M22 TaxID=2269369 RepID=UPI001968961D